MHENGAVHWGRENAVAEQMWLNRCGLLCNQEGIRHQGSMKLLHSYSSKFSIRPKPIMVFTSMIYPVQINALSDFGEAPGTSLWRSHPALNHIRLDTNMEPCLRQSKNGVLHADGDTGFACHCISIHEEDTQAIFQHAPAGLAGGKDLCEQESEALCAIR
jgi:hypothetical protein